MYAICQHQRAVDTDTETFSLEEYEACCLYLKLSTAKRVRNVILTQAAATMDDDAQESKTSRPRPSASSSSSSSSSQLRICEFQLLEHVDVVETAKLSGQLNPLSPSSPRAEFRVPGPRNQVSCDAHLGSLLSAFPKELAGWVDSELVDGKSLEVVTLLQPAERLRLVDDDKQEGVSQALLTDLFTKMSLKSAGLEVRSKSIRAEEKQQRQ